MDLRSSEQQMIRGSSINNMKSCNYFYASNNQDKVDIAKSEGCTTSETFNWLLDNSILRNTYRLMRKEWHNIFSEVTWINYCTSQLYITSISYYIKSPVMMTGQDLSRKPWHCLQISFLYMAYFGQGLSILMNWLAWWLSSWFPGVVLVKVHRVIKMLELK